MPADVLHVILAACAGLVVGLMAGFTVAGGLREAPEIHMAPEDEIEGWPEREALSIERAKRRSGR